ncbi:MAG: 2-phosphosulfolactate phosphatase [Elusimicrobia bacterium]|nr:2-phosphosulfolactate phosphatase [Elusimicrobiota bacterium]
MKQLKSGTAKIWVSKTSKEAITWKGPAAVVDVLRCSTTLCCLLKLGKREIKVFGDKEHALAFYKTRPDCEFFSELDYPNGFKKFDNSPYEALNLSDPNKPAVVVTAAGTKAMLGLKNASRILVGCFANLPYIADYIAKNFNEVLIVPASLFHVRHIEDEICAQAICDMASGKDTAAKALQRVKESGRIEEFIKTAEGKKPHAEQDVEIVFNAGAIKAVPEIKLNGDFGEVVNLV